MRFVNDCTNPTFLSSTGCSPAITSCPNASFSTDYLDQDLYYCSCERRRVQDMYIIFNTTNMYCEIADYHDLNRYSPLIVTVESSQYLYTIEFWIFIETYVPDEFKGYDIKWDEQLRIQTRCNAGL